MILSHAAQGSFLNSFLTDSASMDPEQRGRFLEEPPEGAPDIDKAHEVILLCFHLQACWAYREQVFCPCIDALGWLQRTPALMPMLLPCMLFKLVQPRACSQHLGHVKITALACLAYSATLCPLHNKCCFNNISTIVIAA